MGREQKAKRLRRVVKTLSIQEAASLSPSVAAQYGVRVRTLRRASLYRLTGTLSIEQVTIAFCREHKRDSANFREATEWATGVRTAHPSWVPGDPVPASA
jgi:hypothetical protein